MIFALLQQNISILSIFIFIIGALLSIALHEYSHAKSAQLMGDMTPVYQGRVTLNPLAHLDPVGTLFLFLLPPPFTFGWGKPVEVNPDNMGKYPERKYFISSIVGPITNFILAMIVFGITWGFLAIFGNDSHNINIFELKSIFFVLVSLFTLNISLMIFNLIPLPPLDGSKIWGVILPYNARVIFEHFISKYSLIILLVLVAPIIPSGSGQISIAGIIISPAITFISDIFLKSIT